MDKVEGASGQPRRSRIALDYLNVSVTLPSNERACQRDEPWITLEAHNGPARADLICQHMQNSLRATPYIDHPPPWLDPRVLKVLA
jgi:hypothetical protein